VPAAPAAPLASAKAHRPTPTPAPVADDEEDAMRVRDLMSTPVITVRPGTPITDAAGALLEHSVAALPVVDAGGGLCGIVSEADLIDGSIRPATAGWPRPVPVPRPGRMVADIMTRQVVTTTPDTDAADAAAEMIQHGIRSIPVVEDGAVVGIVARRDMVRSLLRDDQIVAAEIRHRLDEYSAGSTTGWSVSVDDGAATVAGSFFDEAERTVVYVLARTAPGVRMARVVRQAPAAVTP
jgi:CBS domain-containing protein